MRSNGIIGGGQRSRARPRDRNKRLILGGGAALLLALAGGTATIALMAHEQPAAAQPAPKPYVDTNVADQVAKAEQAVKRCDKAAARRQIANLKKSKEILDGAAKTGFVQGAGDDAKKLGDDIKRLEIFLSNCRDTHKATGPGGEIYGFFTRDFSTEAGKYIDDAQRAARDCDRDLYKAVIKALHDSIAAKAKNFKGAANAADDIAALEEIETLRQLERDLIANEEEAFKKCPPPGKAEQPKAEAPKEPPKAGTGTGATPGQAPKPPEPPKAPPMAPMMGQMPDGRVSLWPTDLFGGTAMTGELILAVGFRFNSAEGEYSSNGSQAPGSGSGSETRGNVGGGINVWWPVYRFGRGPIWNLGSQVAQADNDLPRYDNYPPYTIFGHGLALGVLSLGGRVTIDYLGDGQKEVLQLIRHGSTGAITLTESERSMVSLLLMVRMGFWFNCYGFGGPDTLADAGEQYANGDLAQAPRRGRRANWWPVNLYAGAGPSFVRTKVTMTSNQAPGGGVFQTASQTKTDTAWSFVLGAQTAACRNCVFGRPLMLGVEGQWTWLPSRSVSVTSSTFGFTETGRVSSRSSSRVMFTASVPFTIGR